MFFHIHIQEKMSKHVNKAYIERYSEPKICSNCTARLCLPCLREHSELFPSRKTQICFHCKLVKCKKVDK